MQATNWTFVRWSGAVLGTVLLLSCGDDKKKTSKDESEPAPKGWEMYGYDLANSQSNPTESAITKDAVKDLKPAYRIRVGAGATSTPAIFEGTVYFGGWDGFFYAVEEASGALTWKSRIGRQFVRSTPLVTADRIYIAADRSLFALDRKSGETLYETPLIEHPQGFIESSPKLADGVIVLGLASYELNLQKEDYTFEGAVVGLEAETGKLLWKLPVTGEGEGPCKGGSGVSVWSSAAIDRKLGLAYIGTGQTYEAPASTCNDSLLAIHYKADHKGERLAWKATFTKEDVYVAAGGGLNGLDHDIGAAPNLFKAGDVDAVGVGDKGGTYRAFDRKSGKELWRAELDHSETAQLGGVMTTAAVHGDTIFVASNQWKAFGFILTGEHVEQDTSTLYALDAETGKVRWSHELDAPVFGSFAVVNGLLFHPTIRGTLYARDLEKGRELWKVETEAPIGSGISVSDSGVYVSGGFALGTRDISGQMMRFAVSPGEMKEIDLRENTFKELTFEQCQEALATLRPDEACRTCLCECNPSTTGACQEGCWEQAPCIVKHCSKESFDGASGQACYEDHCSSKLLPPSVYQESIRSAQCVLNCAEACGF